MKKLIAVLTVCMLVFGLVGCSSQTSGGSSGQQSTKLPEPAANVDPEAMHWGWHDRDVENLVSGTSDMWYPSDVGENETDFIYFTDGHVITKYVEGKETKSSWVTSEDKHAKPDGDELDFDVVFIDNFTLYDYATETYYLRGSQAEQIALLEGKKFVDDDNDTLELSADGVAARHDADGEVMVLEWEVVAQKVVRIIYPEYDDYDTFFILFEDDGSVKGISKNPWNLEDAYLLQK